MSMDVDESSSLSDISNKSGNSLLSPPALVEFPSSAMMPPIDIEISNDRFVVYRIEHAQTLLEECRIVGEVVGVCPDKPMDPLHNGPPYMFMPEQVSVLLEYGKFFLFVCFCI
uniref:TSEN34 N-terminal domain-containing protein n=1 Tax=Parascaris univalens TaxID=6257 RepID=A0A915A7S9_PARUN